MGADNLAARREQFLVARMALCVTRDTVPTCSSGLGTLTTRCGADGKWNQGQHHQQRTIASWLATLKRSLCSHGQQQYYPEQNSARGGPKPLSGTGFSASIVTGMTSAAQGGAAVH